MARLSKNQRYRLMKRRRDLEDKRKAEQKAISREDCIRDEAIGMPSIGEIMRANRFLNITKARKESNV